MTYNYGARDAWSSASQRTDLFAHDTLPSSAAGYPGIYNTHPVPGNLPISLKTLVAIGHDNTHTHTHACIHKKLQLLSISYMLDTGESTMIMSCLCA